MKKDETGLTKLNTLMALQEAKIDLSLDTIEAIATLGVEYALDGSIPLEKLIPILSGFTERMDELCSEPV